MKTLFILLITSGLMFTANSCTQCNTCRKYPAADVKLCKKDFASDDSFTQAIHYQQSLGYNCE